MVIKSTTLKNFREIYKFRYLPVMMVFHGQLGIYMDAYIYMHLHFMNRYACIPERIKVYEYADLESAQEYSGGSVYIVAFGVAGLVLQHIAHTPILDGGKWDIRSNLFLQKLTDHNSQRSCKNWCISSCFHLIIKS